MKWNLLSFEQREMGRKGSLSFIKAKLNERINVAWFILVGFYVLAQVSCFVIGPIIRL